MNEPLLKLAQRISGELSELHIVRNVYALQFDVVKVQWLVEEAPTVFAQVRSELLKSPPLRQVPLLLKLRTALKGGKTMSVLLQEAARKAFDLIWSSKNL